jgi:hypothetical protein
MSPASAAVLRWTLRQEERELSRRRARVRDLLSRIPETSDVVAVTPIAGGESGFLRFALIDAKGTRSPRPDLGVLRGYPLTLVQHPQLGSMILPGETAGKGSQFLRDRLFTVPTHSRLERSDLVWLVDWLDGDHKESGAPRAHL